MYKWQRGGGRNESSPADKQVAQAAHRHISASWPAFTPCVCSCKVSSVPVSEHGDEDIYSMSRLRWLDSTAGIDDTVPPPFVTPRVLAASSRGGRARAAGRAEEGNVEAARGVRT